MARLLNEYSLWPTIIKRYQLDLPKESRDNLVEQSKKQFPELVTGNGTFNYFPKINTRESNLLKNEFIKVVNSDTEVRRFIEGYMPHLFTFGNPTVNLTLLSSWCFRQTSSNSLWSHSHTATNYSVAYYIRKTSDTRLIFIDPRGAVNAPRKRHGKWADVKEGEHCESWSFNPKEGELFLFPSYLIHYSDDIKDDSEKLVISANFVLKELYEQEK